MAKGKVPTRDELLAFIKESATPVGKREIARAFGLKGDQRIELKELLRNLRDSGDIAADRAKTFKDPKALTDITVLEIVRVDDDGPGIPVDEQEHIFEKFGRAAGSPKPGSGLGLFLARSFAEAHGGSLRVDSRPGEGAAFTLTIPLESEQVPTAAA